MLKASQGGEPERMSAETVMTELTEAADPEKAAFFPRFFKTRPGEYAEGDRFLGVTVPEQRRIARRHRDTPLSELAKLVGSPIHEHRLTGFLILAEQFRKADEEARAHLFAFCRKHLAGLNNVEAAHRHHRDTGLHPERRLRGHPDHLEASASRPARPDPQSRGVDAARSGRAGSASPGSLLGAPCQRDAAHHAPLCHREVASPAPQALHGAVRLPKPLRRDAERRENPFGGALTFDLADG